nr:ThiF family adenylyltransferase [Roseococcus pinisoli]
MDVEHAVTRNLPGRPSLSARLIVLVGCGSIGSHLARLLIQCGAGFGGGRLVLLDMDTLATGNLGRHWLGAAHIGSGKAAALASELERFAPGVAVQGIGEDAMDRLGLLSRADLLIDATGEEGLSRALNRELVERRPTSPDAIFVWLVGQGAAAQALYVASNAEGRGCLDCCFPFGSRPAVLRENATLDAVPAACGEADFMPYGVAAPAMAAGLAAAMALEWAGGGVQPSFRTLRVDHSATNSVPDTDVMARTDCPTCGAAAP